MLKEEKVWEDSMEPTLQCTAQSKRSGKQCGNYSVKGKKVCKFHGGLSTGPKTEEGRQRIREARTKHGRYSSSSMQKHLEFRWLMDSHKQEMEKIDACEYT